jgi:hypothetical protein
LEEVGGVANPFAFPLEELLRRGREGLPARRHVDWWLARVILRTCVSVYGLSRNLRGALANRWAFLLSMLDVMRRFVDDLLMVFDDLLMIYCRFVDAFLMFF